MRASFGVRFGVCSIHEGQHDDTFNRGCGNHAAETAALITPEPHPVHLHSGCGATVFQTASLLAHLESATSMNPKATIPSTEVAENMLRQLHQTPLSLTPSTCALSSAAMMYKVASFWQHQWIRLDIAASIMANATDAHNGVYRNATSAACSMPKPHAVSMSDQLSSETQDCAGHHFWLLATGNHTFNSAGDPASFNLVHSLCDYRVADQATDTDRTPSLCSQGHKLTPVHVQATTSGCWPLATTPLMLPVTPPTSWWTRCSRTDLHTLLHFILQT